MNMNSNFESKGPNLRICRRFVNLSISYLTFPISYSFVLPGHNRLTKSSCTITAFINYLGLSKYSLNYDSVVEHCCRTNNLSIYIFLYFQIYWESLYILEATGVIKQHFWEKFSVFACAMFIGYILHFGTISLKITKPFTALMVVGL